MLVSAVVLAALQQAAVPSLREYAIDVSHSAVGFTIGFMRANVRGQFDTYKGTLLFGPEHPEQSSITVVIEARSIHTGSAFRDEHLRSADFFDVARYPSIRFQSTSVRRAGLEWQMRGPLTIHGVTRVVTIPFSVRQAPYADPHGSTIVNFASALRIARKDFGVLGGSTHNNWFDALRSAALQDTVLITLEVQGWATDFERALDPGIEQAVQRVLSVGVDSIIRSGRARLAQDPKALEKQEWALDQVGRALLARGRPADGVKLLRFNAEVFPQSSGARASLGSALLATGATTAARAAFEQALELDPDNPRAAELLRRQALR